MAKSTSSVAALSASHASDRRLSLKQWPHGRRTPYKTRHRTVPGSTIDLSTFPDFSEAGQKTVAGYLGFQDFGRYKAFATSACVIEFVPIFNKYKAGVTDTEVLQLINESSDRAADFSADFKTIASWYKGPAAVRSGYSSNIDHAWRSAYGLDVESELKRGLDRHMIAAVVYQLAEAIAESTQRQPRAESMRQTRAIEFLKANAALRSSLETAERLHDAEAMPVQFPLLGPHIQLREHVLERYNRVFTLLDHWEDMLDLVEGRDAFAFYRIGKKSTPLWMLPLFDRNSGIARAMLSPSEPPSVTSHDTSESRKRPCPTPSPSGCTAASSESSPRKRLLASPPGPSERKCPVNRIAARSSPMAMLTRPNMIPEFTSDAQRPVWHLCWDPKRNGPYDNRRCLLQHEQTYMTEHNWFLPPETTQTLHNPFVFSSAEGWCDALREQLRFGVKQLQFLALNLQELLPSERVDADGESMVNQPGEGADSWKNIMALIQGIGETVTPWAEVLEHLYNTDRPVRFWFMIRPLEESECLWKGAGETEERPVSIKQDETSD